MADDLYGGFAPKQGCFGCFPKVLHDAKPTEQAISDTHFYIIKRFIYSLNLADLSVRFCGGNVQKRLTITPSKPLGSKKSYMTFSKLRN